MVYKLNAYNQQYKKLNQTTYKSFFNADDQKTLIGLIERISNKKFINDPAVRLEGCIQSSESTTLTLSKTHFYDFLISNYLKYNFDKFARYADEKENSLLMKFKQQIDSYTFVDFQSILKNDYLSNILAVSVLIIDKNSNVLLVKRNHSVGISNGFISTSATGSVDMEDFNSDDPILNCAKRETKEELNYELQDLELISLVCGYNKIQPIALVNAYVNDVDEIISNVGDGFSLENDTIISMKSTELINILNNNNMTEACNEHLCEVAYNG